MSTILKNVLSFSALVVGVPVAQPHLLNLNSVTAKPRILLADGGGFTIIADATNVTVTRTLGASASVNVYCELWHSIEDAEPQPSGISTLLFPFVMQSNGASSPGTIVTDSNFSGDGSAGSPLALAALVTVPGLLRATGTAGSTTFIASSTDRVAIQGNRTLTGFTSDDFGTVQAFMSGTMDTSGGDRYAYGVRGTSRLTKSAGASQLHQWGVFGIAGIENNLTPFSEEVIGVVGSGWEGTVYTVGGSFRAGSAAGISTGCYAQSDHSTAGVSRAFWANARTGGTRFSFYGEAGTLYNAENAEFAADLFHSGTKLGFYNTPAIAKPTVTGAKGGNAALTDLLSKLASLGIITDSTT